MYFVGEAGVYSSVKGTNEYTNISNAMQVEKRIHITKSTIGT